MNLEDSGRPCCEMLEVKGLSVFMLRLKLKGYELCGPAEVSAKLFLAACPHIDPMTPLCLDLH